MNPTSEAIGAIADPEDLAVAPQSIHEDEGEIAADYIEELLDIADLDGDIEIDTRGGRSYLSVTSSEHANLRVLARPETVGALQELTRIAVQTKTGEYSRLILDIGGSREARAGELAILVEKAIERLEGGAGSAALPQCRRTSANSFMTSSRRVRIVLSQRAKDETATRSFAAPSLATTKKFHVKHG